MVNDYDSAVGIIKKGPWFKGLPIEAVEQLAKSASILKYLAGDCIYPMGGKSDYIYCVISGRIRVSVSGETGQEFSLVDFHVGFWFGESSLVPNKTTIVEASAVDDSHILTVPASAVSKLAESFPLIYKNLFFEHMARTGSVYDLLSSLLFKPLKARLAGRLLGLLDAHGVANAEGIELGIQMSQSDFARMCMGSRQRVNKIFRTWVAEGILKKEGDRYVVLNVSDLKSEMESDGG